MSGSTAGAVDKHSHLRFVYTRWFKTFLVGFVFLIALLITYNWTQFDNVIPSVLLLAAFLIPVTFIVFVYDRTDIGESVPKWDILMVGLVSGVIGVIAAAIVEYETFHSLDDWQMTVLVGPIEEAAKIIIPLALYFQWRHRSEAAGLMIGIVAGAGFAILETMGYGFDAFINSGADDVTSTVGLQLMRGVTGPGGHLAWTGLLAAALWRERIKNNGSITINRVVIGTYLLVAFLHSLYDTVLSVSGDIRNNLGTGDDPSAAMNALAILLWLLSFVVIIVSFILLLRRIRIASAAYAAQTGDVATQE